MNLNNDMLKPNSVQSAQENKTYATLQEAWNAPLPEKGAAFKKVEDISALSCSLLACVPLVIAGNYLFSGESRADKCIREGIRNNVSVAEIRQCDYDYNYRDGRRKGIVLGGAIGIAYFYFAGVLGELAANKVRDLGYRSMRVLQTANRIYNPINRIG